MKKRSISVQELLHPTYLNFPSMLKQFNSAPKIIVLNAKRPFTIIIFCSLQLYGLRSVMILLSEKYRPNHLAKMIMLSA